LAGCPSRLLQVGDQVVRILQADGCAGAARWNAAVSFLVYFNNPGGKISRAGLVEDQRDIFFHAPLIGVGFSFHPDHSKKILRADFK